MTTTTASMPTIETTIGWSNLETCELATWIDRQEELAAWLLERAECSNPGDQYDADVLSAELRERVEELTPMATSQGPIGAAIRAGLDLVDFDEIATAAIASAWEGEDE